jgi:hypothetical protein
MRSGFNWALGMAVGLVTLMSGGLVVPTFFAAREQGGSSDVARILLAAIPCVQFTAGAFLAVLLMANSRFVSYALRTWFVLTCLLLFVTDAGTGEGSRLVIMSASLLLSLLVWLVRRVNPADETV